ncbi:MAG: ABC transporter permease [Cytophagales bacterium]|nr:ABC transporter permease [Cytophagales bacterium]
MLNNYLKTALRYLLKNKVFSLVNVVGMATGLSCVLIILSYVDLELSYDDFHTQRETIFRVAVNWEDDGQRVNSAKNHAPLAPILEGLSGIVNTVRMYPYPVVMSADRQNKIKEAGFCFADSTFFRVFTFRSVHGDLASALDAPFSVVLTESAAIRHFGSVDVLGREFHYEDERRGQRFTIMGVMEDLPQNTHFNFDILASFSSMETLMPRYNNWHYPPMYIYARASSDALAGELDEQMNTLIFPHLPDYVQAEKRDFFLQPVTSIHLYSDLENEWKSNSNDLYTRLFIIIAIFILLVACVNFVNMATARSIQRAKEVGMRKALGAQRKQLIFQFLGESVLTTALAFVLAFVMAELVMRYFFQGIIEQEISLAFIFSWSGVAYTVLAFLTVSILSGLYPAFYLSSHKPLSTMKSGLEKGNRGFGVRRMMVIFQFFISSVLIAGTIVVLEQTNYLKNKDLGFDKENIIAIKMVDRMAQDNYQVLKDEIVQESSVVSVALSSTMMGTSNFYGFQTRPEGIEGTNDYTLKTLGVDEDFLSTYNLRLLAGRDFSKDILTDQKEAVILNEAAAKKLNWENPVNKEFGLTIYTGKEENRSGKVIGVVEDFHFASLYNRVEPLVIYINKHPYYSDFLSVKLTPGNLGEHVDMLRAKWKAFNPEKPFEYYFVDEELDKFYKGEVQKTKIFSAFAALSIFISCLGLFGISAYMIQQRTKEVGIRKVLGAGIPNILWLLSAEYVRMILIANLLALPLAWYLGQNWLTGFEYRTELSIMIFVFTLAVALLLAVSTVSIQALKAASMNPVNTLRDE